LSKELDMVLSLLLRLVLTEDVLERFTGNGNSSLGFLALILTAFLADVFTGASTFVLISG
jgi:hypothetical protein